MKEILSSLRLINAGALLSSLVVFDESHLLEAGKSMDTAIEMLKRLLPFSQFVIMTATMSSPYMALVKEILEGEVIRLRAGLEKKLRKKM